MSTKPNQVKEPHRRLVMPKESGWYFLPAVASTFFIIGSVLGGGAVGLVLNVLMLLLALVSFFRPTVFAWAYLMVGCLAYTYFLFSSLDNAWHPSPGVAEWAAFTVLGLLPTLALWWHRPKLVLVQSLGASLRETAP